MKTTKLKKMKKGGADRFGNFISTDPCSCNSPTTFTNVVAYYARHVEVPMCDEKTTKLYENCFREPTYPVSHAIGQFTGKGDLVKMSHDAVEFECYCKKCGMEVKVVIELSSSEGPIKRYGYYEKKLETHRSSTLSHQPSIDELFESHANAEYNLIEQNCKHYAIYIFKEATKTIGQ